MDELKKIADMQIEYERKIEDLEKQLKDEKEKLNYVSTKLLPDTMSSIGIQEFKTDSGFKISLKQKVFGNISNKNKKEAFSWLTSRGYGDSIKKEIVTDCCEEAIYLCNQYDIPYHENVKMHHMTLSAIISEMLENGEDIPFDIIGVHVVTKSKITKI